MTLPSWLVFLMTCIVISANLQTVQAQVSQQNPLIWQTLVTPTSSVSYRYVSNSTMKYYSQDFQTVFSYNDGFGHNERILVNMGDGCNEPTYDDILYYNNGVISSFIKRQYLIGLVSRGGCSWSTKINNLQKLVQENTVLTMTAILIYDNTTYTSDVAPILVSKPNTMATLPWSSSDSLSPPQRNISNMQDNDVRSTNMQPFMAIYFVPRQFGLDMLAKMTNNNSQTYNNNVDNSYYVQLAPYFTDSVNNGNSTNANGSDNTSRNGNIGNTNDGTFDSLFGDGNRGYIAYLVAAGIAIIMAIVLFRWCRKPRLDPQRHRENGQTTDLENQVGLQQFRRLHQDEEPPAIPIDKLNVMCPIQTADQVITQMKNMSCCICLDDFRPSSNVRLLPCHHGFCVGCIDVWLTKKSSLCPICKHDCREVTPPTEVDNLGDLGNMTMQHRTTTSLSPLHSSSSSSSTPSLPHDINESNTNNTASPYLTTSRSPICPPATTMKEDMGNDQTASSSTGVGSAAAATTQLSVTASSPPLPSATTESSLPPPSYSSLRSTSETTTASPTGLITNPHTHA